MPTTNLALPLLSAAQAQKHVTVNEALVALDSLTQSGIIDRNLTAPPGSPSEGDTYIVGASATGDWSGKDNNIATYYDSIWRFYPPKVGWLVYVVDEGIHLKYDGSSWVVAFTQSGASWGWQDWEHNGSSQTITSADTFYRLDNDGAGSNSSTTYKISGHGNIWNTSTNRFDFSDLSVGDEVLIRVDLEVTTSASNDRVVVRLQLDIGGTPFELPFIDMEFKNSGSHRVIKDLTLYIGSTGVRDNPAELQISSDTTGDSVQVNGWYVKTQVR